MIRPSRRARAGARVELVQHDVGVRHDPAAGLARVARRGGRGRERSRVDARAVQPAAAEVRAHVGLAHLLAHGAAPRRVVRTRLHAAKDGAPHTRHACR